MPTFEPGASDTHAITFDLFGMRGIAPDLDDVVECEDCSPSETGVFASEIGPVSSNSSYIGKTQTALIGESLERAKAQARLRQRRLRIPTLLSGGLFLIVGILMLYLRLLHGPTPITVIVPTLWFTGAIMGLLSLLPTDRRAVRHVACFCIVVLFLSCPVAAILAIRAVRQMVSGSCMAPDSTTVPCWALIGFVIACVSMQIVFLISLIMLGFGLFRGLSPQSLLSQLWALLALFFISFGSVTVLVSIFYFAAGHNQLARSNIIDGSQSVVVGIMTIFSTSTRHRVQSWFMSRGEVAVTAAGIACLVGDGDLKNILNKARHTFLYVRADRVRKEHMKDNKPNPELAALSEKGTIGFVDAFVSHSWHDDADEKWAALQEWVNAFKATHNREPLLWIDRFCIDQNNSEENLQCLPVYLAGCKRLLILCGTTYLRRLWCIIEVFIFQQMGGGVSNLDVELLAGRRLSTGRFTHSADNALEKLKEDVRSFDPMQAKCFSDYDTLRLRDVVNAGGGSMESLAQYIQEGFVATQIAVTAPITNTVEPQADMCNHHYRGARERNELFDQAKTLGSYEGAMFLHTNLPARYWGITKAQLMEFVEAIRAAVQSRELINVSLHKPYSDANFFQFGPNAYQATQQYIKPHTDARARTLPYASYSVAKNSEEGMQCDLFLSHAWDEGIFSFGRVMSETWPINCNAAYLCFLANPQNLDIASMVESPTSSPFYCVLESGVDMMLMVSNQNSVIHSRLWCVFEAYCAQKFGIPIGIAGDPLWLITEERREDAEELLAQIRAGDITGRAIDSLLAEVDVDVHRAQCFSEDDKRKIWREIGPHAPTINMSVKELIAAKFLE